MTFETHPKPAANPFQTRPRIRGYKPCALVTNRENKRGQVLVEFEDRARLWISADKVDRS